MSRAALHGRPETAPTVTRNDLELRDVRDGELVVSHNRVERGHSHTEARHVSDRLPLACLALFEAGTIDVDSLTDEERAWIAFEGERIAFEDGDSA